jgi:pyruvate/2-oxoglutarate dehydrogenase complex dihydrolipoamide acyltransferase (E2) component
MLSLVTALVACSTPAAAPSDGSSPSASTSPPPAVTAAASAPASAATPAPATAAAPAEPVPSASAEPSASAVASAAPAAPIPAVKVANIGMHIGGGPHDNVTKAPIKQSVEPHVGELKKCWSLVDDPKKGGDFGVDLLIEKAGGKAKVTNPRTSLKGKGFKECLVTAFEAIDFKKPRGGTTMVSYSIRFTP